MGQLNEYWDAAPELAQKIADSERAAKAELEAMRKDAERYRWQPIETAPRDGTEILLTNGKVVSQGWWMNVEGGITEHRDGEGRYIGQEENEGYVGWWDVGGGMLPEPTHYMPLPEPPHD